MKKKYFSFALVALLFGFGVAQAQNAWINELHYDNIGTDAGEFVEIVIENPGSYALSDFAITLYNGNSGGLYDSQTVDNFTVGTVSGNFTIYTWMPASIQNGAPDGLSLSYQGTVISGQFLSYEGTLTATDGPAVGLTSTDMGVTEDSAPVGESLQLLGVGTSYEDFAWQMPAASTQGNVNNSQSFGGSLDPEPTNYPTAFNAIANELSINLSWTDAIGAQLPRAYLIQGVKPGVTATAPVDGVPVAEDLDWSDGIATINVNYGVEAAVFSTLLGSMEYSFYIYPYTNAGANIDYKTDGTVPVATATTVNATVISFEDFATGLGVWTPYNVLGEQVWIGSSYGGITFAKMSGYAGVAFANEDWLISPQMDLDLYEDINFSFSTAANYSGPALQLYYSQDYDGAGDPNDFTWIEITDQADWSGLSFLWVESGDVSLDAYASSSFYLAYKFTSTDIESATWEVTNCLVMGVLKTGIQQNDVVDLVVYPNPASNQVTVLADEDAQVMIINLMGQTVKTVPVVKGANPIALTDLTNGMYLVKIDYKNGTTAVNRLMVK